MTSNNEKSVIVIGAGIAGLTAAALLAHEGLNVTLMEAHSQVGGCAGTFRRGPFVFDVGATQVAGLEQGGIHERIFRHLNWPLPVAHILDPACVVDLGDGTKPIYLWHDPDKWEKERNEQFPGSEPFWKLCNQLHKSNWIFASNDPILPVKNFWDFKQLIKAVQPSTFGSALFSRSSVADLLWLCSCGSDLRLRKFLDLQLKLYSQENIDQTSALYGATVLQMAQSPLGLWHLEGSMQKLSDHLTECFLRDGGNLLMSHKVVNMASINNKHLWKLDVIKDNSCDVQFEASDIICTLPPQSLLNLMSYESGLPNNYRKTLEKLPQPNGAIVFYGAIDRSFLSTDNIKHLQLNEEGLGSLFVSISSDGDGRAPLGQATCIGSVFTDVDFWSSFDSIEYKKNKDLVLLEILEAFHKSLGIDSKEWLHKELATPKSFARWTGRPLGIVGGLGQKPNTFGPFGLASRTPMKGLWLCGDSIYPGEGTAGVSQSALMVCKQVLSENDKQFNLCR